MTVTPFHSVPPSVAPSGAARFLTARWLDLALLNFEIDPDLLRPLVPVGTELDPWQGRTMVSLVGFLFRDTRLFGLPIPFHRHFEEVNLRFYVRRRMPDGWRRGVVFIKEFVGRWAVAWTARTFYGENYATAPMGHRIERLAAPAGARRVGYWWRIAGRQNVLEVTAAAEHCPVTAGSEEEFITEHYWGYSGGAGRATMEYCVEHPRWNVCPASGARFEGDVAGVYGPQFVESLTARPTSAFLADGSAVTVYRGCRLS